MYRTRNRLGSSPYQEEQPNDATDVGELPCLEVPAVSEEERQVQILDEAPNESGTQIFVVRCDTYRFILARRAEKLTLNECARRMYCNQVSGKMM